MRRDVRLLGDLLGEVLSEASGQDLLDDVERLRHAVIAERHSATVEQGTAEKIVAAWPLARAEAVAHAFTVYFHLANLAEEHQRIRTLRERDTGREPVRESLAAAVADIGAARGPDGMAGLLSGLRVHPVLTAHPTEARRRAVTEALRRISALLDGLDDPRRWGQRAGEAQRRLREEIDLLWRTSALRAAGDAAAGRGPAAVTASSTRRCSGWPERVPGAGPGAATQNRRAAAAPSAPAFLRFGSWIGADRDGNPFVTAQVTRQTARDPGRPRAARAGERGRADRPVADRPGARRRHRARASARALESRAAASIRRAGREIMSRSPEEPFRAYLLYAAQRLQCDPAGDTGRRRQPIGCSLCLPSAPAEFIADVRLVQRALAAAGAAGRRYGELQHLIWQAETFGFHLAELEVRQHSAVHAAALAELTAAPRNLPGRCRRRPARCSTTFRAIGGLQRPASVLAPATVTWSASPRRRRTSRRCYELAGSPGPDGHAAARRGPAVRERGRPC